MIRFFPAPFLVGLAVLALALPLVWRWKHSVFYLAVFAAFWIYMEIAIGLTLFPLPFPRTGIARYSPEEILAEVYVIPFYYGRAVRHFSRLELGLNLLLTIPFGLLLPRLVRIKVWAFLLIAAGTGLLFEGGQLILSIIVGLPYRVVDINDVLMNSAGALVGYFGYLALAGAVKLVRHLGG